MGPDGGVLTNAELRAAYDRFAARPEFVRLILTGGDPLMLSARRLAAIVEALSDTAGAYPGTGCGPAAHYR